MAPIPVWSAIGLALALVASAQAAPLKRPPLHKRDFIVTERGEGTGGCGPYYYRGAGGNCVQGGGRQLCARRWLQSVPSRSVLDAVRLLAWPAISRGLWQLAKKAGVEFTNGKRPGGGSRGFASDN
jgi:hypothetical protein